jgi:hypothetical protein
MSNLEIITNESTLKNFPYDGSNLLTFGEWKKRGYVPRKGEKAFLSTKLWKKTTKIDKQTGKTESFFCLVTSHLFTFDQVTKLEQAAK